MSLSFHTVRFTVRRKSLAGCFVTPTQGPAGNLLFLHGGRRASKDRCLPLALSLAENYQISSFLIDFSGHGSSQGSIAASSLKKRVEESEEALIYAKFPQSFGVFGFSMGAHIAIELLDRQAVRALILFAPAVYAAEVFDVPFGDPRFLAIAQQPNSWESSSV